MGQRDFLNSPSAAGESAAGLAPDALFDLAVNRAQAVQQSIGPSGLNAWHARTRFARRVSLEEVRTALQQHPREGEWHWVGGPNGQWVEGKAAFP